MALVRVTSSPVQFVVLGDNVSTVLDVDLAQEPFSVQGTILRVQDLIVTGIPGLTATRTFLGSIVTLTFSAAWVGAANVRFSVLI